jgi:RNA polymerase sigma factor (TIGR02999 family)
MWPMGDITRLLIEVRQGDAAARKLLFERVYGELQGLARSRLGRESTLTQLDVSSLVHEAYLRLNRAAELPAENRRAFFAYAAAVMRSVVVDYVRERQAAKRGSGETLLTLETCDAPAGGPGPEVEALDTALQSLRQIDERCHQIVELRYFAGMSVEEIAEVLELSPATVKRDWQKARAFLFQAMQG